MYSRCPECQTRFRVTATALRAARGTVRCGRCGAAFDALESLSDAIPPPEPEVPSPSLTLPGTGLASAPTVAEPAGQLSARDLERVFAGAGDWREPFAGDSSSAEAPDEVPGGVEEPSIVIVDEGATVEDITLEGEGERVATPEEAEEPWPAAEPEEFGPATATAPAEAAFAADDALELPRPSPRAEQRWTRTEEPEAPRRSSLWSSLAWTAGSLVLALALAAQVIHHYRQDLVRHPRLGPPLRAAYERIGLPLLPNWDLAAFELRQWGSDAGAAAGGGMVVRASLKNRASFAQPHPILRLELEDRFGGTVATRDFEPADYLKNPSQASRMIAPGATSEAELLLADPGVEAVGYRLDVCLRESATLLRCAQGTG